MKDKMNNGFYCTADYFDTIEGGICKDPCNSTPKCHTLCKHLHRKYPTVDQFYDEYKTDYTDEQPVWLLIGYCGGGDWEIFSLKEAREKIMLIDLETGWDFVVVCACTPFGKPDNDWRPE